MCLPSAAADESSRRRKGRQDAMRPLAKLLWTLVDLPVDSIGGVFVVCVLQPGYSVTGGVRALRR